MHGPNGGGFRPVSAEAGTDPLAQRFDRPDFRF